MMTVSYSSKRGFKFKRFSFGRYEEDPKHEEVYLYVSRSRHEAIFTTQAIVTPCPLKKYLYNWY